jgi:hypothetical protein
MVKNTLRKQKQDGVYDIHNTYKKNIVVKYTIHKQKRKVKCVQPTQKEV